MPVWDLYSKRQRRARGEVPEVYQFVSLPGPLREQISQVLADMLGTAGEPWKEIFAILIKEYGVAELVGPSGALSSMSTGRLGERAQLLQFVRQDASLEQVLDVIEVSMHAAVIIHDRTFEAAMFSAKQTPVDGREELNARFREHGVGFQIEGLQIVRVDSQVLHAEAVKPVLSLLSDPVYQGPEAEFLSAHEHYRHGKHEEAIVDSLKALESMLKVICDSKGWGYAEGANAKALIDVVFAKGLFPPWMQAQFSGLRGLLEAGVPTIRNKSGGHGQGATVRHVPGYLAAYALHTTASAILLLAEASKAVSPKP